MKRVLTPRKTFAFRQYGETAIVAFRLVATTDNGGTKQVAELTSTPCTFLKREGKWQAVSWQATAMPSGKRRDLSANRIVGVAQQFGSKSRSSKATIISQPAREFLQVSPGHPANDRSGAVAPSNPMRARGRDQGVGERVAMVHALLV